MHYCAGLCSLSFSWLFAGLPGAFLPLELYLYSLYCRRNSFFLFHVFASLPLRSFVLLLRFLIDSLLDFLCFVLCDFFLFFFFFFFFFFLIVESCATLRSHLYTYTRTSLISNRPSISSILTIMLLQLLVKSNEIWLQIRNVPPISSKTLLVLPPNRP